MAENTTASHSVHQSSVITRIVCLELFLWIIFSIDVYVLCAMLRYERKVRKKSKLKVRVKSGKIFRIRIDDFAGSMRSCVIVAACAAIMRNLCEHLEVLLELSSYDYCDVTMRCKYLCALVFFSGVYVFLWMRQRLCYTNHAMKHLSSKGTRYCSWFLVVFILLVEMLVVALFVGTLTYGR